LQVAAPGGPGCRLYRCKAKRTIPEILILKDYSIVIAASAQTHGEGSFTCSPMELFGFGLGDFAVKEVAEWDRSPVASMIKFNIEDDLSCVAFEPQGNQDGANGRMLIPLCEAIAMALSERGIADIGMQFYKVTPKSSPTCSQTGDDPNVRLRYDVQREPSNTVFVPAVLSESELANTEKKHATLGSTMQGHLDKLPVNAATLVWDVAVDEAPPAMFKPIKPKLWLNVQTTLLPGMFYKLT
jgi:hypothetical protein